MQGTGLRIGLWDWDLATNTVAWSEESYRQWGYTRETFSGRIEDAIARVHPEDRSIIEEAVRKVLAGNCELAAQYRICGPMGLRAGSTPAVPCFIKGQST
jgi:PAS domain-containing protein